MTQKELIAGVAEEAGMTKTQAETLLGATTDVLLQALLDGKSVLMQNFGTLEVKQKNERLIVHPKTGERTMTPARRQVSFKPNTHLKDELKQA